MQRLEIARQGAYYLLMTMIDPTKRTRTDMLADLEASDAEVDAGLFVPSEVVRQGLLDSLARMKAKRDQQPLRGAARRR